MNVSIIILTYNEEDNLPRCLEAMRWCDDIIVVDSGSTDRTLEICAEFNTKVLTRPFDNFAHQRNYGLEHGNPKYDWVLHVDADEVLPAKFTKALIALTQEDNIYAYQVPSKIMLNNRWLKHSGCYPVYQVRLGHKDHLKFIQIGHGQREDMSEQNIGVFSEPYLHYNFSKGMKNWLSKHVTYAQDEALLFHRENKNTLKLSEIFNRDKTIRRRALKTLSFKIPLIMRPPARFLYLYFLKLGFLDGKNGLMYSIMVTVYEGMIAVFYYENQGNK